jgi:hypothetical protein
VALRGQVHLPRVQDRQAAGLSEQGCVEQARVQTAPQRADNTPAGPCASAAAATAPSPAAADLAGSPRQTTRTRRP